LLDRYFEHRKIEILAKNFAKAAYIKRTDNISKVKPFHHQRQNLPSEIDLETFSKL